MSKYDLSPIHPTVDLRDMLRSNIIARCLEHLDRARQNRTKVLRSGSTAAYCDRIIGTMEDYYAGMPVGANGAPPAARLVSSFDKQGYTLQNVIFESFPGWEVNATVYVPLDFRPPFPAVVVPVGHSGKQFDHYQLPCQYFAKCGYLAVLFDPPGQSGEKQPGNDHFVDGVRCYLVGETSSRYFIADALRCIDYLETRDDVDLSQGVAMTGVSGGGTTTIAAGLIDDRITVVGPSCCHSPSAELDLEQCYSGCPETHMWARYALGLDDLDLVCAMAPKPMLLMAGEYDEVFLIEDVKTLAAEVGEFYQSAGASEAYQFYVSPSGHGYTLDQARAFVEFMDKHLLRCDMTREWPSGELTLDSYEQIMCKPRSDVNMQTLTLQRAQELQSKREVSPESIFAAVWKLANIEDLAAVPEAIVSRPFAIWDYSLQHVLLRPEPGIELPATYVSPQDGTGLTVVHFDDDGRDRLLKSGGLLTNVIGFMQEDARRCNVLSVDLRGCGDSAPCMYPYDLAGWGSPDRCNSYLSAELGDSVLGMRIRDGLSAVAYARATRAGNVLVSGCGLGGVVALHVAAVDASVSGVVSWDILSSFISLLQEEHWTWPTEAFFPNVLLHYDIPELVTCLDRPVRILRPLDGAGHALNKETIAALNRAARREIYLCGSDEQIRDAFSQVFELAG
jgi:dienelactone hydrolase